jgi:outer membrane protein, heavy metal efflux system
MNARFVQVLALLLLAQALYGQNSQSSEQAQSPRMPGMEMPDKPEPQKPNTQQMPPDHEHMPGIQMPQTEEAQQSPARTGPAYTLEQLQQLAIDHNPTLKQAQAEIRAAEGRKRQAGLYPNLTVGYIGEQISGGSQRGGEQGGFIQQDIVLGGKLGAAQRVFEQERLQADAERGEQLLRVQNAAAIAYYQSLGAQQTVAIRRD